MARLCRILCVTFLSLLSSIGAQADDLADARRLLLTGSYAESAEIYQRSATKSPAAAVGLARALASQGKYEDAAKALAAFSGQQADVFAEQARWAFLRGDCQAARSHVDRALKLNADQLLARWVRGELQRTAGRLQEATETYRGLVKFYNEHDVKDAESLHWIGLGAAHFARWKRLSDQFSFLVNELYPDAVKADPNYWPAHYEAGLLFLEKYNEPDATREFQKALTINPRAAEVHVAMALTAMAGRDQEKAEASLQRALEINPRLREAWLLKADLAWSNFQPEVALELLEKHALPLNPVDEETLGRVAACYLLLDGPPDKAAGKRFAKLVEQVNSRNAHAGEFYQALASCLGHRNRFAGAEKYFREAIERMPQLVGPQAELALMHLRTGDEAQARRLLEKAFEADPFHVRVKNSIEVLEVVAGLQTLETEHLIVKFDGQRDKLLGRYVGRQIDAMYVDLCNRFGYRPPGKPLVEIFSRAKGNSGRNWFSTRMIGLPYLGAVAASTGKIVAMTSPNDSDGGKKYNWARILKHELVHVITLQQTTYNCPHWFTEGLAVWSEGYPRPHEWNELLVRRMAKHKLFNLTTIDSGFIRPHSCDDGLLAYCQSNLYVEYMLEGREPAVLKKLLAAYADGLSTPPAIRRVFGMSVEEFERGYDAFLKKTVVGFTGVQIPRESFSELAKAQKDDPKNPDLAAELAFAHLSRGDWREAANLAKQARELRPGQPLAAYVLARIDLREGRASAAVQLLESCLDEKAPELRILSLLGALRLKGEKYAEAERLYQLGRKRDPLNPKWDQALAIVYTKSGNQERLEAVLNRLALADADDFPVRKKLVQVSLKKKDYPAAVVWANRALEINVQDAELYRLFAESQVGSHNSTQAIELFETAIELDPTHTQQRFALADAYLQAGKREQAREALESLKKIAPDYPGVDLLLESLRDKEKR